MKKKNCPDCGFLMPEKKEECFRCKSAKDVVTMVPKPIEPDQVAGPDTETKPVRADADPEATE